MEEAWVTVPREAGSCEGDDSAMVMAFLNTLHDHLPEDERPTSWMQYSDDQRARIKRAYVAMLAASPPVPSGWRDISTLNAENAALRDALRPFAAAFEAAARFAPQSIAYVTTMRDYTGTAHYKAAHKALSTPKQETGDV